MVNKNFCTIFDSSGLTKYRLSCASGVPYTTIERLVSDQLDINKCSVKTVKQIADALNTPIEHLLNPYSFLDKKKETYRGIKYQWLDRDGEMYIVCSIHGKQKELKMGKGYDDPNYKRIYHLAAEMHIDYALDIDAFERRAYEYERLFATSS